MSALTPFFNLIKRTKSELYRIKDFNDNFDTIDLEMHRPPLTVNGISPNPTTRDLTVNEVPLAGNLSSDIAQLITGAFVQRMSGGGAAVDDGDAFLSSVEGNSVISGVVAESLNMTITPADPSTSDLSGEIDRDTFVAYVNASGTYTLTYSGSAWSADPTLYGVTLSGTPASGDVISIVYVKANRGTITNATPSAFNSTGWNLFNRTVGYARVCKYSDEYGYKIGGSYTAVSFAATIGGATSIVAVDADGYFNVPGDGFVYVTGGDATTYIYATWTEWIDNPPTTFEAYSVSVIDFTEAMVFFPYGLCAVGAVKDEIDLNTKTLFRRIDRLGYSAENLETVVEMGVDYIVDTNYIYYVSQNPVSQATDVDGSYTVSDHGVEFFTNTSVPAVANVLYGENLKDKLRTDVLTISEQTLSAAQQAQVRENIGAVDITEFNDKTQTVDVSSAIVWGNRYVTGDEPTGTMYACGNMRMMRLVFKPINANSGWTTICTLPPEHRTIIQTSTTTNANKTVRVQPTGEIEIYDRGTDTYYANIQFMTA